jgi:ketosteroid isomerase-like protein
MHRERELLEAIMTWSLRPIAMAALIVTICAVGAARLQASADDGVAAFNAAFRDVILRMDNAGVVALWAEDGVSLLPDMAPIVGKKAIAEFMDRVTKDLVGYRVTKEEIEWKDSRVAGDWASEWGIVHQEVLAPGDKPPIEVYGRIALVLHREAGGWKIEQEMWNSGPKPTE